MPEVVRAAVARVRQLPGAPRGRVVPVQLLYAVAVTHEVQHLVLPLQVLNFLERGLQDAGPLRLVPSPDAVPLVVHGQAVDGAVHPGRVRQLDARRGRDARAQFPVELADDHEVAAALDGVFDRGDAARARLRIVQPAFGREIPPFPAVLQRPDDGLSVQGPALAGNGLAPEQAVHAGVEGTGVGGEGAEVVFGAVHIDPDQPGRQVFSLLDREVFIIDPGAVRIIGGVRVFLRDLHYLHKWRAGILFLLPDFVEALHDALESLLEGLPGDALDIVLEPGDREGALRDVIEIIGRERRLVIEIPHAGDGHITDCVIIGSGFLERAVGPLVPVPPVPVVEGEVVVVQEVGVAPAAGGREGGFRDDGVAFQEHGRGIESAHGAGPHLAHQVIDPLEGPPVGQLHLRHVAGLMDRELRHPGLGVRAVGLGMGVQVHPLRGPGHGAVGIRVPGVQDHRRPAPLQAAGRQAGARAHRRLPFFQVYDVGPRQGIQAPGINDAVMLRAHLGPAAERVRPGLEELGRCGGPGQQARGEEKCPEKLHTTKLTIFS